MGLTPRKLQVLAAIVDLYIKNGEPVGSKAVCNLLGNAYSSATIRNDMSELSEQGYLEQPHTSAGRIPSHKGYRLYIDRLMQPKPLSERDKQELQDLFPHDVGEPEELVNAVGRALAEFTRYASIATTPVDEEARIQRIELIPMTKRLFLFVLLTSAGLMKSRPAKLDNELTTEQLELFIRCANAQLEGMLVSHVTPATTQTMAAALGEHALSLAPLMDVLSELVREATESQIKLGGEANLLIHRELGHNKARELLQFLARHDLLLSLLSRSDHHTNVFIGEETQEDALDHSSIVSSQYRLGGKDLGYIGIIGPTRMDYSRLIPSIEYFATLMGQFLAEATDQEEWRVDNHG